MKGELIRESVHRRTRTHNRDEHPRLLDRKAGAAEPGRKGKPRTLKLRVEDPR